MKKSTLRVQRDEDFEDQLIGLKKLETKKIKTNPNQRVVKIPISKTEEYKHADPERRMHMWYMFRGLRSEFDKIERNSEGYVCRPGCCQDSRR
jgi:hypothetical protein